MVQFAKICLLMCAGLQYAAGAINANYEYSQEVDAWLRLHMVPVTWAEAGMRCFLEGGVLASPTTSAMAGVMTSMMAKGDEQQTRSVFTGINSILTQENYTSLEGVPLSSIPLGWAPGQPDNGNSDEDCVALTGAGKLADVSCNSLLRYFCRKESDKNCDPRCNGGSTCKGYEWEPRTGSYYKFHNVAKTWLQALDTCHTEGGDLAIINSQNESTVLKEIFAKYPSHMITNANNTEFALVGFRQWDEGNWATIHGTSLAVAGFEQWKTGEPSNGDNANDYKEDCGSIYQNGYFNDVPCEKLYPFICEITPDEDCVALTGEGKLADVSCNSLLRYFCRKESDKNCDPRCNGGSTCKGYEWEPRTGSYYKFHNVAKTWLQALDTCHTEGGDLAIINSQNESTVLKEIFAKYPSHMITNANNAEFALVGFRQWDEGNWATIHGTSLAVAGFEQWKTGEPNNYGGKEENCGSICRDGFLNDLLCDHYYAFICEITP